MMNRRGKSDSAIVPEKPPNKGGKRRTPSDGDPYTGTKLETAETAKGEPNAGRAKVEPTAEEVEGRELAKGNSVEQSRTRAQYRIVLKKALDRVRTAARRVGATAR